MHQFEFHGQDLMKNYTYTLLCFHVHFLCFLRFFHGNEYFFHGGRNTGCWYQTNSSDKEVKESFFEDQIFQISLVFIATRRVAFILIRNGPNSLPVCLSVITFEKIDVFFINLLCYLSVCHHV